MIAFVEGKIAVLSPTAAIIETGGLGYDVQISLNTYEKIKDSGQCRLLTHLSIKEDSHTLFGFFDEEERGLFRHLISVNGVGTSTARMILSSLPPNELTHAIIAGNVSLLKAIKGIGPKTAQRLILELQDKIRKQEDADWGAIQVSVATASARNEAVTALVMLGFNRAAVEKVVRKITDQQKSEMAVEEIIKIALKSL